MATALMCSILRMSHELGWIDICLPRSSNEEKIITLQGASEADVDTAVSAARVAFNRQWSELPAVARGDLLLKLSDLINRDRELLASIEAFDNGKVGVHGIDIPVREVNRRACRPTMQH